MPNNYFDASLYAISEGTGADASDVNTPMSALEVSFDILPAPHANAPTTKGFGEVFSIEAATALLHPPTAGQIQNQALNYADDTGSANTYVIAPTPAITAYAAGQRFSFKATEANTGASTLAVSGKAATPIKNRDGTDIGADIIPVDGVISVVHDGTNFQIDGIVSTTDAVILNDPTLAGVSQTNPTSEYAVKTYVDSITPPDATTTIKGIVELATNTETKTGTDTVRSVVPAGLTAMLASPKPIGSVAPSTVAATTISATGQMTSTVADGTPPLVVASTTEVANLKAAAATLADTATNHGVLKVKVVEIGDWDMDTDASKVVAHGLAYGTIRSLEVMIRPDVGLSSLRPITVGNDGIDGELQGWVDNVSSSGVAMVRLTGGDFDGATYDETSYNRGWITIFYVD